MESPIRSNLSLIYDFSVLSNLCSGSEDVTHLVGADLCVCPPKGRTHRFAPTGYKGLTLTCATSFGPLQFCRICAVQSSPDGIGTIGGGIAHGCHENRPIAVNLSQNRAIHSLPSLRRRGGGRLILSNLNPPQSPLGKGESCVIPLSQALT